MDPEEEKKKLAEEKEQAGATQGLTEEKQKLAAKNASKNGESSRSSSFYLVVIMLLILFVLVGLLIFMPLWISKIVGLKDPKDLMDYYKWGFSVLLGAFGAWIGAGAAYFFGKENLAESSRSTEAAMRIQQESFRRPPQIERIKDMTLTALNQNFIFDLEKNKDAVKELLSKFKGYWFVPVVDKETGILKDIIHAQVFWDPDFKGEWTLKEIVAKMDENNVTKILHGESFYVNASSNDKISDVYNLICQKTELAIVVDEKGKASHYLTKTDLRTFLKVTDSK